MNKTRKSTYAVETKQVVDLETGETGYIETVKRQKITIESEPFYMVFIDYIAPLFNLSNSTAKSVLAWMCSKATFNTGQISLSPQSRTQMMADLNISKSTLSNILKELQEKKLINGERGSYIINPQIFWKGDLLSRNALLNTKEIRVTFDLDLPSANIQEK